MGNLDTWCQLSLVLLPIALDDERIIFTEGGTPVDTSSLVPTLEDQFHVSLFRLIVRPLWASAVRKPSALLKQQAAIKIGRERGLLWV